MPGWRLLQSLLIFTKEKMWKRNNFYCQQAFTAVLLPTSASDTSGISRRTAELTAASVERGSLSWSVNTTCTCTIWRFITNLVLQAHIIRADYSIVVQETGKITICHIIIMERLFIHWENECRVSRSKWPAFYHVILLKVKKIMFIM